jgi:hypothetical protein
MSFTEDKFHLLYCALRYIESCYSLIMGRVSQFLPIEDSCCKLIEFASGCSLSTGVLQKKSGLLFSHNFVRLIV